MIQFFFLSSILKAILFLHKSFINDEYRIKNSSYNSRKLESMDFFFFILFLTYIHQHSTINPLENRTTLRHANPLDRRQADGNDPVVSRSYTYTYVCICVGGRDMHIDIDDIYTYREWELVVRSRDLCKTIFHADLLPWPKSLQSSLDVEDTHFIFHPSL